MQMIPCIPVERMSWMKIVRSSVSGAVTCSASILKAADWLPRSGSTLGRLSAIGLRRLFGANRSLRRAWQRQDSGGDVWIGSGGAGPVRAHSDDAEFAKRMFGLRSLCLAALVAGAFAVACSPLSRLQSPWGSTADFRQADVASIHRAMLAGQLTARQLVEDSIRALAADAVSARSLHAVVRLVDGATAAAAAADAHLARTGQLLGPLHGIPIVVKDNIDVAGVPTSLGLAALAEALPPGDAEVIARVRRAGGIVVAKTNLASLARSSRETVSEVGGRTRNPYATEHTIGGSSGGSAAAVAAGFATLGLGTDTGASIRGPAAHACLVGFRPTFGVVPMAGIAPLYVARDTVGPLARSVADAARLLAVLRDDAELLAVAVSPPPDLRERRLGVVTRLAAADRTDPEVAAAFAAALDDLRRLGATVVALDLLLGDADLEHIPVDAERFPRDLDAFLATRLPPHDQHRAAALVPPRPRRTGAPAAPFDPAAAAVRTEQLRERLAAACHIHGLDALVYPTWSRAPLRLDAGRLPNGDNSGFLVPPLGLPALSVPMGFTADGLPLGIEFAGMPDSEVLLTGIAAVYEWGTQHRRPPRP